MNFLVKTCRSYSLFLLIVLFTISCSSFKKECKYFKGFSLYLKNTFDFEVSDIEKQIFYMLPLAACDQCLQVNIDMLERFDGDTSKITMVLIGTLNDAELGQRVQSLTSKFKTIKDRKSKIYKYETGLSKPLLVHIEAGKCKMMKEIADNEIEYISEYLIEQIP